eukprot:2721202-Rhodomonas_salina.2
MGHPSFCAHRSAGVLLEQGARAQRNAELASRTVAGTRESPIALRVCYGVSGTDRAYRATRAGQVLWPSTERFLLPPSPLPLPLSCGHAAIILCYERATRCPALT